MPIESDKNAPQNAMGVAFNNARQQPQAPAAAAPIPQPQQAASVQQPRQQQGFNFSDLGRLGRTPMGRTPASESLIKLQKLLAGLYESADKSYQIDVLPVDMNNNALLNVSAIAIVTVDTLNPEFAAYHTLILESSIDPIPPRFENIGGKNVEILRTAADANDAKFADVIADQVQRRFPGHQLANAYATVVPRDFRIEDPETVWRLAQNSLLADVTELQRRSPSFKDLNLAEANSDQTLVVRSQFSQQQTTNAVGMPVRADVTIDLTAAPAGQQNNQGLERTSLIARTTAFIDLVWNPKVPQANPYAFQTQQPQSFVRYNARAVATSMETTDLRTTPAQLLALVPLLALREQNAWMQAFRPAPFEGHDLDMRDIGAIGIEVNFEGNPSGYGKRVDTKADSFAAGDLPNLISGTFEPGLIISLDVMIAGPDQWYNDVFFAAAEGRATANQAIVLAANYLTNGAFANHFPQNGRVATNENNGIHMGYYTDRHGVRRDLRDLDYLAVLNILGDKEPDVVREWSDTYQNTGHDLRLRMSSRKRIIQAIFQNAVFTGIACRVTFEAEFLEALAAACRECGLDMRSIQPYADNAQYQRATAQYAGSTLLSAQASGLFNRGFGGGVGAVGNQGRQSFATGMGRWN